MKFVLNKKVFFLFLLLSSLFITVLLMFLKNSENVKTTNDLVEHTQDVIHTSDNVLIDILNIETGARGYLLTGNDRFLGPFNASVKSINTNLNSLLELTRDNSRQQLRIHTLENEEKESVIFTKKLIFSKRYGKLKEDELVTILSRKKRLTDKMRRILSEINTEEFRLLNDRKLDNEKSNMDTKFIFLLLIFFTGIILVFIGAILKSQKEKNKVSEDLKKSNELFHGLFNHNPVSLSVSRIDDGKLIKVNDSFMQLFGFLNKEEVIGKTTKELGIYVDSNYEEGITQRLKEGKTVKDFEINVRTKQGEVRWISDSVLLQEVEDSLCLFSVSIDVTHRKKAEEQLRAVNNELEAFTYSVSHDLRAPLRAINGYATILKEDFAEKLDAEGLSSLNAIQKNSKRMGDLIDDLLAFSRLGRKEMITSEINMTALVKSVREEEIPADSNKIDFVFNELLPGNGHQALIKQVWTNLISNAIKYSKNRMKINIEIGSYYKDNRVVYYIRDNGVGFDMQYYDKLFGVFQRLHSSEEFEGTGIGLAIVQKIVNRHDGRVWAESKLNEGTCFYFSLPTINSLINVI